MKFKKILYYSLASLFLFPSCAIHKKNSLEELCSTRNMNPNKIEVYEALINKNIDWKLLAKVHDSKVDEIYWGLESKRFPKYLFETNEMNNEEYSVMVASSDPDFDKSKEFVQDYIKKKLSGKNHLSRTGTDYSEHFSQVYSTYNKEMLFLIKKYIDFFDNEKNWPEIENLFRDNEERGGHFLEGKKGYSLIEIKQKSNIDKTKSYMLPATSYYINKIGDFHTHPLQEPNSKQNYAGPAGNSRNINLFERSDFMAHRKLSNINPYTISIVITEIDERKYNVDAYFQDMEKYGGITFKKEAFTVLDLGIWDFSGEQ